MKNLFVAALMVAFSSMAFAQGAAAPVQTEQPAAVSAPSEKKDVVKKDDKKEDKKEEKAAKKKHKK